MWDEADLLAGVFAFPRLQLDRGEGCRVWDSAGREYLDFTAGLAVAALGHGRKDLAAILAEQFGRLGHCSNLFGNAPALELAARLKTSSFADKIWLANSGAEVNEAALKFARLHGTAVGGARKNILVAFRGGFHGRTMGALALTHHPEYRKPFAPLMGGVRFASFNDLDSVQQVLDERVCGVFVEPVQGEGGVVPAAPGFLAALRALCDRHDALLVFDEIQCGLGRLGALHAHEAVGVTPDISTLAKPLAGGLPLGAALLNARVAGRLKPGQHGSTFAGGPAVCAVAARVFDEVARPELLRNVREMGARLAAGLSEIAAVSPLFRMARGAGLMQALVVARPKAAGRTPGDIVAAARRHGLLVTRAGDDAVRLLPPLVVNASEVDEALDRLARASAEVAAGKPARPLTVDTPAPAAVTGGVR